MPSIVELPLFDDYILNGGLSDIDCSKLDCDDIEYVIGETEVEKTKNFSGFETSGGEIEKPASYVRVEPSLLIKKGFATLKNGVLTSTESLSVIPVGTDGLVDLIINGQSVISHLHNSGNSEMFLRLQQEVFTPQSYPNGISDSVSFKSYSPDMIN